MTFDRHDDRADGPNDVISERPERPGGSGGEAPMPRAEPTELRTRAECYEALRAVDGKPVPATDSQDAGSDPPGVRVGWDAVDEANRPPLDALRVTSERTKHILDGDAVGSGGHRHGVGNPGKTEFPASWTDEKVMDNVIDVAHRPDRPPIYQNWNNRWLARATRDDVEIAVVITSDGLIWSGWPLPGGPGVVKNPKEN
jgi:Bacterial EndoU nuclease